jgi:hypothetical protein
MRTSNRGRPHVARRMAVVVSAIAALVGAGAAAPTAAMAAPSTSPWWHVVSNLRPANLPPGGEGTIVAQAVNVGDGPTAGPVTIADALPPGVSVVEEEGVPQVSFFTLALGRSIDLGPTGFLGFFNMCSASASTASCTLNLEAMELLEEAFSRTGLKEVKSFENIEMRVKVKVAAEAPTGGLNKITATGGGTPPKTVTRPVSISSAPPVFGAEDFTMVPEEERGTVDAQAGSHPFQLTTTFSLNENADPGKPIALPRNLRFKLPAGLLGNTTALPQCSDLDFRNLINGGSANSCPENTVVGVASITIEPEGNELQTVPVPLFNLVPGRGEPARFGFEYAGTPVALDTAVRTGSDYGVNVSVNNITELATLLSSTVTFWGTPGDPAHNEARGWGCIAGGRLAAQNECVASTESHPKPFLTLPTSCASPFRASVEGVSWPTQAHPAGIPLAGAEYSLTDEFGRSLGIVGCDKLPFAPTIEVQPDVQAASSPTGLTVHVRVPQEVSENAAGLASSSVKDTTVALPQGVGVNPSGADGLEACSEDQVGFTEVAGDGTDLFTPALPTPFCPAASKIGTVKFKIPLIEDPLEGAVYLATQNQNPFGSLVAIYVVAEDPISGVLVKLAGNVQLTESGQIITTFTNSPQAPLEEAEFHFFGGSRAPLSTPAACGAYETKASFGPWSGGAPADAASTFQITSGPNGSPCPSSLPFAPTLAGGSINIQAGAFTPLTTTISRDDGNQDIQSVQLQLPPGFAGIIASVTPCGEASANAGTCGPESLIGHTIVSVGLGGNPFTVTGGQVFLTGPYRGAPFGLSIVNPAKAGPFDLGKVVVRAKLELDPHTVQARVTTDPAGPFAIPHILDGIPLQIKHVNVTIDRPGFAFNPTNCSPLAITGAIGSDLGSVAPVSLPFHVTNCASLKFPPKFSVSTAGRTSKAKGASLSVKLAYPRAPFGTFTNIAKVKVSLPKQLPSRLTTLQKACLAAVFDADPTRCPAASVVGHAKVITPALPVALEGSAYFVSHGGEAFPDLTIVLEGDNVTVDLVGSTQIKNGVTTSTFRATPDVPFDTFELSLPQASNSALAANANLCSSKLTMPTEFTAQNGAVLRQSTPIKVTGCTRLTRAQRLAKALKECRRKKRAKRAACERRARKRYGAKTRGKGQKH